MTAHDAAGTLRCLVLWRLSSDEFDLRGLALHMQALLLLSDTTYLLLTPY